MFSRMLIYVFVFLGFFALLLSTMPTDYLVTSWDLEYQTDKEAAAVFQMANITAYRNLNTTTITWDSSILIDVGLAEGHYIQLWWANEVGRDYFEVRHIHEGPFGLYWEWERLSVTPLYMEQAGISEPYHLGLLRENMVNLWENQVANASYCEWHKSGYYAQTFIMPYNDTWSIGESWDNQYLNVTLGYEFDYNATKINAFNLLGQILFFDAPSLGLGEGAHTTIFEAVIAIPLWIMIAILALILIQSVIPFIKGINE